MITKRGKCRKMIIKFADTKYQAAAHRSVYYLVNNLYIIYIIYMPYEEEQDMSSRVSFSTNIFFPMIIIIMIMYSDGTWYQSIQDPIVIFHRTRYQPSLLIPNLKEYLTKTIFLTWSVCRSPMIKNKERYECRRIYLDTYLLSTYFPAWGAGAVCSMWSVCLWLPARQPRLGRARAKNVWVADPGGGIAAEQTEQTGARTTRL